MSGLFDLARRGGVASVRQFLIEIQATDQASGVLKNVSKNVGQLGQQWQSTSLKAFGQYMIWSRIGRGMTTVGDQILGAGIAVAKMGSQFDYQMRLARTQTNLTTKQFQDLVNKTLAIAGTVPQATSDIAQGIYDIFSSTDVNYKQAVFMIGQFAKAATAGGDSITNVERSIIAEMNALHKPVSDTTQLLDLQFNMVRYGVGTYEQFASSIGNVLPAARSMNQSINIISGAVAFMTRQGFTASQATISVARAMDQLVRHRADIKQTLGVDIVDKATGQYKQLSVIMDEFGKKMAGMTGPQREKAFQSMFGAGEIRAMRFFRAVIPNIDKFNSLVAKVGGHPQGALQRAFGDVSSSPLVQMQIQLNKLRVIAIKLFYDVAPYIAKFIGYFSTLLGWISRLDPYWQKVIATGALFSGILLVISGRLVILMSLFKGIASLVGLADLTFAEALGPILLVTAAVAGLIVVGYELVKHWSAVVAWWKRNWDTIKTVAVSVALFLGPLLAVVLVGKIIAFGKAIMGLVTTVRLGLMYLGDAFKAFMVSNWIVLLIGLIAVAAYLIITHWKQVKEFLIRTWNFIKNVAMTVWNALVAFYNSTIGKIVLAVIAPWILVTVWMVQHWRGLVHILVTIWHGIVKVYDVVFRPIVHLTEDIFGAVWDVVKMVMALLVDNIKMALAVIRTVWTIAWDVISLVFKVAWQLIRIAWYAIGYPVFLVIQTVLQILWKIWIWVWHHAIVPAFREAWKLIRAAWHSIGEPIFRFIKRVALDLWHFLNGIWHLINRAWRDLWGAIKWAWTNIGKPAIDGITKVWNTIATTWSRIWGTIRDAWKGFWNEVESIAGTVINGILTAVQGFVNIFIKALNWIRTKFGLSPIASISLGRVSWGAQPAAAGGGGGASNTRALARGTKNWQGGWAMVGEQGPELAYIPKHAAVLPNTLTQVLTRHGFPGFAGGLLGNIGHFFGAIGHDLGKFMSMLGHGAGAAAGWLAGKALNIFHVIAPNIGNLVMSGSEVFKGLKSELVTWLKGLVGGISKFMSAGSTSGDAWGGFQNGRIPLSAMVAVAPGMYLYPPAAASFMAVEQITGKVPLVGAYRPLSTQISLARQKGLYSHGGLAAVPGTSRHGWGKAIDVASNFIGAFSKYSPPFNWREDVGREPWHFDWYGSGGVIREPVVGVGLRTGRGYGLAENGPEMVGQPGGKTKVVNFYGIHTHDAREIVSLLEWSDKTDGW